MTKPADLTRFDFNALRFLKSESVEMFTDAEAGQFLLLMCHAWLGAKDASLPNNPTLLAKYARCERVSEAVLREWQEGPDGRLYNVVLSEEWAAATERSLLGSRAANARWGAKESPKAEESKTPTAASSPQVPVAGKTNPRKRYATIAQLADAAVSIWTGNKTIPGYTATDWAEDLKKFAAQNNFEYSDNLAGAASPISQALSIAGERLKGTD